MVSGINYPVHPKIVELYNFFKKFNIDEFLLEDQFQTILMEHGILTIWNDYQNYLCEKQKEVGVGQVFVEVLNHFYCGNYVDYDFGEFYPKNERECNRETVSKFLDLLDSILTDWITEKAIEDFDIAKFINKLRECGIRKYEINKLNFIKHKKQGDSLKKSIKSSQKGDLRIWGEKFIGLLREAIKDSKVRRFIDPRIVNLIENPVKVEFWTIEYPKTKKLFQIDFFKENFDKVGVNEWKYREWANPEKIEEKNFFLDWDFNFYWRYGPEEEENEYGGYLPISPNYSIEISSNLMMLDPEGAAYQFISTITGWELKRRVRTPLVNARIRKISLTSDEKKKLYKKILNYKGISEPEKCQLISKFFYLLGLEDLPLEILQESKKFKKLKNIRHVDVIAYYYPMNLIYLIEEKRKFTKEHFHKLFTSNLQFFAKYIDLSSNPAIYHVIIGSVSSGIEFPEHLTILNIDRNEFLKDFEGLLSSDPEKPRYSGLLNKYYKFLNITSSGTHSISLTEYFKN